jgi:acyl-CoA dehydrogenase family protein 9
MPLTPAQFEQQKKQAEELLFADQVELGFAKSLFFGHFNAGLVFPYPEVRTEERAILEQTLAELRRFAAEKIDAREIDRKADIPPDVVAGLADLGILGMTAPREFGGKGFSQHACTKIMELIGGVDASIGVFVNAHHSIGIRALVLFGTEEQKKKWLPDLVNGKKLAAFALTEPEAGSDAANVQTMATPSPDGKTYFLTGEKRYITNGGIAQVLTVMARTPVPGSSETKVTAFLVTPDMPGFEVVEARMEKCGIRGTATARLAFHDMPVPAENILGQLGKGLRIALTTLDFGRTTFGATCAGAAKFCLEAASAYAKQRIQFKEPIAEFELIKKKIAYMAAHTFAMEALTTQCASFIDRGAEDYMLETAMLKVFATEALWQIVYETLQIHGGAGYFTDLPFERMMRDARINQIGEGANEVLKAFIAVVGMRGVGESLKGILEASRHPLANFGTLWRFAKRQLSQRLFSPEVPVASPELRGAARQLAKRVGDFGIAIQRLLRDLRARALQDRNGHLSEELAIMEKVLKSQYQQERIANAACDLYASACTLSRLDSLLTAEKADDLERSVQAGRYFLTLANRRIKENLAALWDNDDDGTTKTADVFLA